MTAESPGGFNQRSAKLGLYWVYRIAGKVIVIGFDPTVGLLSVCALIVVMALKHYLADFVLQTNWIARGKERREGWFFPLVVHVSIHAGLTLAIVLVLAPRLWALALADLAVHAGIDRGKSMMSLWGAWDTKNLQFWWLLGFDQFLHQATNILLAAALLTL